MTQPNQFYNEQIAIFSKEVSKLKKKLFASSMIRLVLFLLVCVGGYFFFGNSKWVLGIIGVGIALFLYLISRHTDLKYQKDLAAKLIELNKKELEVLNRNFHDLPSGVQYKDPTHSFSQDIDLFGRGSLFQYINRTSLEIGSDVLANSFLENDTKVITEKQKAIQELASVPKWRQHFLAIAALVKTEVSSKQTVHWLHHYKSFIPKYAKALCYGFSLLSAVLITLYFLSSISGTIVLCWFFLGMGISGRYVKKINSISAHTSRLQSTFEQFHKLLSQIEGHEFTSKLLSEKRKTIINETKSASATLRKFARHLSALDQRNNILIAVIANGFMLRDILQVYHIENWIEHHKTDVEHWFETIAFFDGYNSLGNYAFNHPEYAFPLITDNKVTLDITAAGHPLLAPEASVLNDFTIKNEQFFIITGANMAGKSTFLRTVALQIVMANMGLPVCAKRASYTPIKLITSMRTTDSLTDDESYFFSELKRLKFIVDTIKLDRYFIILDEILKGTNSTDKAIGSRKFINKLVGSHSTGIIATHDLSLCTAADELSEVENYYFDAQIINDELFFDYTLKQGVCQNMNASFLLKKMNIVE